MRRARLALAGTAAIAAVIATSAGASSEPATASDSVIPIPVSISPRAGRFTLRAGTVIYTSAEADSARIAAYFADLLQLSHALALVVRELPRAQPPAASTSAADLPAQAIVFRLEPRGEGTSPESYQIDVSPERVLVSARDFPGLFYGAVTLWQLCSAPAAGADPQLAAGRITDTPRFRWRGLMLDSARHFQSPAFVMHYIDWMALHKLNVLGWHLTDDQGWRLAIRKYPRLTSVGAWRVPAGEAAQRDIDPATGRPRLYGGFSVSYTHLTLPTN